MRNTILTVSWLAALLAVGCSTIHTSDAAKLQGSWEGQPRQSTSGPKFYLVLKGNNFDFHDADQKVFYRGTFSIREDTTPKQFIAKLTESCQPQYVGKTSMAIYLLQEGKLTLAGNEPGKPEPPATFDAPGVDCVELTKH
jgi:uncharacterized protein (TIGR03067 family)